MSEQIDLSKVDITRNTFTQEIRNLIKRLGDQEFTALHLITLINDDEGMSRGRKRVDIKRTVRYVIQQDVEKGVLKISFESDLENNAPNRYTSKS